MKAGSFFKSPNSLLLTQNSFALSPVPYLACGDAPKNSGFSQFPWPQILHPSASLGVLVLARRGLTFAAARRGPPGSWGYSLRKGVSGLRGLNCLPLLHTQLCCCYRFFSYFIAVSSELLLSQPMIFTFLSLQFSSPSH